MGAEGAVMTRHPWLAALALVLPAAAASADPAAWRVAGRNGGEITLLGSMHVLRQSDHPLPAAVDALLERADSIVMELDLDDVDPVAQQRLIVNTAVLPRGQTLVDVIDADLYRDLERRATELGVQLELLERFEPWFLSITLLDQGLGKFGFEGQYGIEQYVLAQAQRSGKEIAGLETMEFQIGIFDSQPASAQQAMLAQTLAELDEAETAMAEMAAAWRAGELEELSDELLEEFADFPGLYETLVTKRNAAWVETLERLLRDGRRHLVVVGALHLVGDDSLIELLAARGHAVERVD
ncbi:MAG TPA: TraB/GumN family protein [Gammaproteobacteria bacterium]